MATFKIKRGYSWNKHNVTNLLEAEPIFTLDDGQLYVYDGQEQRLINGITEERVIQLINDRFELPDEKYSLEEQVTNMYWINGEIIYKRTFEIILGGVHVQRSIVITPNLERIIKHEIMMESPDKTIAYPIPAVGDNGDGQNATQHLSQSVSLFFEYGVNTMRIRSFSDRTNWKVYATIWYTKV